MGIVTDSSGGIPENVFAIHKLFRDENELKSIYENKAGKYKELKEMLAEDIENFIKPLRERRDSLARNEKLVIETLKKGSLSANEKASKKLAIVKKAIGVDA